MPRAIRSGVPMSEFYNLTPTIINVYVKEYERKAQEECDLIRYSAWLQGAYVRDAIVSTFSEKVSYPENPLMKKKTDEPEAVDNEEYVGEAQFLQFINALNKKFDEK